MISCNAHGKEIDPSMDNETVKLPITALKPLILSAVCCLKNGLNKLNTIKKGWAPHHVCQRFDKPDDGLPVIYDFVGTAESILFGGLELGREPIDVASPMGPAGKDDCTNREV